MKPKLKVNENTASADVQKELQWLHVVFSTWRFSLSVNGGAWAEYPNLWHFATRFCQENGLTPVMHVVSWRLWHKATRNATHLAWVLTAHARYGETAAALLLIPAHVSISHYVLLARESRVEATCVLISALWSLIWQAHAPTAKTYHTQTHTHTHTYDTGQRLRGMPSTDDVAECVLPLNACYPRRRISSLSPQDVLSRQRKKGEKTSMHYVDLAVIRGRRTQLYSRLPLRWCDWDRVVVVLRVQETSRSSVVRYGMSWAAGLCKNL